MSEHGKGGGGGGQGGKKSGGGGGGGGGGGKGIGCGPILLFFLVALIVKMCGGFSGLTNKKVIAPQGIEGATHCTLTWETSDKYLLAEFTLPDGRVIRRLLDPKNKSPDPIPWPCTMRFFHPEGGNVQVQFEKR